MKIEVERNGKILKINAKVAEVLMRKGIVREAYQTRDMVAATVVTSVVQKVVGDGLDELDRASLHELAKERGVKVHHMAGADKVREALRASQ